MEYRNLGHSGLKVSKMSLGCNGFGPRSDEATSVAIVHAALDAGINLIDTADIYTAGVSETFVGKALKDRRSRAVLATKVEGKMGEGPNDRGLSRQHILDGCDASLKRLGTDYIDLYQVHNWDPNAPLEETLQALTDLVRWGKVRYIGCSNYTGWQIVQAHWVSDRRGLEKYVSNQPHYSPANRQIEREVIPASLAVGVGQIVYFPLAGGLFTGKYRKDAPPPPGSRAVTQGPRFSQWALTDQNFALLERIEKIATEAGLPLHHMVLAWVMQKPGITSSITGATKVEQVLDNVKACSLTLSDDVMKAIDAASAERVYWSPR